MKDLENEKIVKLIDGIEHQGIGGAEIRIEKETTIGEILDMDLRTMPIAMINFIERRRFIIDLPEKMKVFYGHNLKTGLGYVIAEDEIVEIR